MKLVEVNDHGFRFHLALRDRALLLHLLELYPRVPPAHHQVTRQAPGDQAREAQELLDQALAEQRRANQKVASKLLSGGALWHENHRWVLALSREEIEILMQVLNDVRVGSWLLLGAPEQQLLLEALDENKTQHLVAMELAGFFQAQLLQAIQHPAS